MRRCMIPMLILTVIVAATPLFAGKADGEAGKAIFAKQCATCHGAAGEGKEAIAKMLKVTMRNLGSKEVQSKSDADLRKDITEGNGKMKPIKGLSADDVSNVIAFLRTLAKK